MNLLKELLNLREDAEYEGTPIPPRVARLLRDEDIKYPGADTLEKLKVAHAKQLLARDGGEDSAERALSYALWGKKPSKEELESFANPKSHVDHWDFTKNDPGYSGTDTLTTNMPVDGQEIYWHIAHDSYNSGHGEAWEIGATNEDGDPDFDKTIPLMGDKADVRQEITDWIKHHGLPMPTDDNFKKMGL